MLKWDQGSEIIEYSKSSPTSVSVLCVLCVTMPKGPEFFSDFNFA